MRAYVRLFLRAFQANFASLVEYRANFLVQLFGMMLNNASFLVFWAVLLSQTGTLAGWGMKDVMYLWALSPSAFGLAHIVFGNVRQLGTLVVQGDLDVYLLQPKDVFFHALISRTVPSAWGDLIYGFVLLPFLTLDPVRWLLFTAFVVTGALVFTGAFALLQALAFWMGNVQGLAGAFQEFLLSFTLYPETVLPQDMRWVFYTLIPSGFIVFLPLKVLREFDWMWIPVVAAASLAVLTLAWLVFRWGLRRYESGNSLGGRL